MNIPLLRSPVIVGGSRLMVYFFALVVGLCFITIHRDATPSQAQIMILVYLLPFLWLLPVKRSISRQEIVVTGLGIGLFLSSLVSYQLSGDGIDSEAFRAYWVYLFPLGLLALFSCITLNKAWLVTVIFLSAVACCMVVYLDMPMGFKRGVHHGLPIPYGQVSLITALVALIFFFDSKMSWFARALLLSATILSLIATFWSLTRGAWVFGVMWVLVGFGAWLLSKNSVLKKLLVSVFLIGMVTALAIPNLAKIEGRVELAQSDIKGYFLDGKKNTSIGQRFELWRVSIEEFLDNPLLGGGRTGFIEKKNLMYKNKDVYIFKKLEHSHNDVLWMLSTRGLIGLLLYSALHLYLLYFYLKSIRVEKYWAYTGLTLTLGSLVFGLTDIFFSLKITLGYFFILQMMALRSIHQSKLSKFKQELLKD